MLIPGKLYRCHYAMPYYSADGVRNFSGLSGGKNRMMLFVGVFEHTKTGHRHRFLLSTGELVDFVFTQGSEYFVAEEEQGEKKR